MGKNCGSWLHRKNSQSQSPNLNYTSGPSDPRWKDMTCPMMFSSYANPYACTDSTSRVVPGFPVSQFPQASNNCYPYQTCSPNTLKSMFEERCSVDPQECFEATPNTVQKSYFVFDRLRNPTNLLSVGHPLQVPSSTNLRILDGNGFCVESVINREPVIPELGKKYNWCGMDENHETGVPGSLVDEMHEDTEELDALLCSDDDEKTSTGHSPSDMTGYRRKEVNDSAKVAHFVTPTKKRRLDEVHDPSLMDTASSGKAWEYEDDAESSCVKIMDPSIVNKQFRKKRIRETMGVLRSIIPGVKGKDAAVLLDEAIQYLKSLKLKAKPLGARTANHF